MISKGILSVVIIIFIILFQVPSVKATEPNSKPSYEQLYKMYELQQERIHELESKVQYLENVLESVRSQVGGGGYVPTNKIEPHSYVE